MLSFHLSTTMAPATGMGSDTAFPALRGGAGNLDGLSTTGLSAGQIRFAIDSTGAVGVFYLKADTAADNGDSIVRGLDYGPSNQKVWERHL